MAHGGCNESSYSTLTWWILEFDSCIIECSLFRGTWGVTNPATRAWLGEYSSLIHSLSSRAEFEYFNTWLERLTSHIELLLFKYINYIWVMKIYCLISIITILPSLTKLCLSWLIEYCELLAELKFEKWSSIELEPRPQDQIYKSSRTWV